MGVGATRTVTETQILTETAAPTLIARGDGLLDFERRQLLPEGIPTWAGNCKSKAGTDGPYRFSSACSCFFRTTGLPPVTMPTVAATTRVTVTTTKTLTQTPVKSITSLVPGTTVVTGTDTKTDKATVTITEQPEDETTTAPTVAPTATGSEYYIKVSDAVSSEGRNDTYRGWYLTGDPRPFSQLAFTLTPDVEAAIKFQWVKFEGVDPGYDAGYFTYLIGTETVILTVEDGAGKSTSEMHSLLSANAPPLPANTLSLLFEKDGNYIGMVSDYYRDITFYDNDEGVWGDQAGRLWTDWASPQFIVGVSSLGFSVEPVLPEA